MTAHEVVAKAKNLPKISEAALKLIDLLDESVGNNERAVELIKTDALLTAKLLRVCNSSAFALSEPVSSVNQAVFILGYNQVLSLVLSLGFGSAMTELLPGSTMKDHGLWRHSFTAAAAADAIVSCGTHLKMEPSVAFTAGLLHDIGKLVMAQALSEDVQSAIRKLASAEKVDNTAAEKDVLGTDHAEVGACLLHVWRLPDWIVEAVGNHHTPVMEPAPHLSAVACLANYLAHLAVVPPGTKPVVLEDAGKVADHLRIGADACGELVEKVRQSVERARELLHMV